MTLTILFKKKNPLQSAIILARLSSNFIIYVIIAYNINFSISKYYLSPFSLLIFTICQKKKKKKDNSVKLTAKRWYGLQHLF